MRSTAESTQVKVQRAYYAATAIFLLLDYLLDFNVRLAFLEAWPGWRLVYYAFCFACLGAIVRWPALTTLVTTVESLITLAALILSMGVRVMSMSVTVLETGGGIITMEEILNFCIAGGMAWYGWFHGARQLRKDVFGG